MGTIAQGKVGFLRFSELVHPWVECLVHISSQSPDLKHHGFTSEKSWPASIELIYKAFSVEEREVKSLK